MIFQALDRTSLCIEILNFIFDEDERFKNSVSFETYNLAVRISGALGRLYQEIGNEFDEEDDPAYKKGERYQYNGTEYIIINENPLRAATPDGDITTSEFDFKLLETLGGDDD